MTELVALDPVLRTQIANGQLSHAYIFQGASGGEQALAFAAALCCRAPLAQRPCGSCPVCRNIRAGSYPDCRVVEPDRGTHRIGGMREMALQAQLAAIDGDWKVFILPQADHMTDDAANNLLKLLEEPPERTVFILVADQPEQLLPTVLSRCQLFVLGRSFGRSEQTADPQLLAEAEQLLRDLPRLSVYEILLLSRQREKKEEQRDFLFALLHVLHQGAVGALSLPMAYPYLLRSETMVESSLELIDNNVNQKLLSDVVYLRLWQNSRG